MRTIFAGSSGKSAWTSTQVSGHTYATIFTFWVTQFGSVTLNKRNLYVDKKN